MKSYTTIDEWGTILTRYLLVYGTLRYAHKKGTKNNQGNDFVIANSNMIGTYLLPQWKMFYSSKVQSFPIAVYTGDSSDYIVVEILDLLPNGTKNDNLLKFYESHFLLDTYEGLHSLYRPVVLNIEGKNNITLQCKIYEGLVSVDNLTPVANGNFISPKTDSMINYDFLNVLP